MKRLFIILTTLFYCNIIVAQEQEPTSDEIPETIKGSEAIDALKTAFITKELELSAEEAQKFWPVYNDYVAEIKKAKKEAKDDVVAFEEKKVNVLKKYKENFKKILGNDDRVKKCFNAAPRFHQMLKKEWIRRQGIRKINQGVEPRQHNQQQPQPQHFRGPRGGPKRA